MNEIKVFENQQFGQLRTVIQNGELWFVAVDVCKALEHSNVTVALDRVDEDEKAKLNLGLSGGETNAVTEGGMWSLVLGSRKPEAKAFKRWVTHEVIPAIRKHGGYLTPAKIEEVLLNPDTIIRLATDLKTERAERVRLEQANAALLPKAEYFDELVNRNLLTNIRDTAKEFKTPEREFSSFLIQNGYMYRDSKGKLLPYAPHIQSGLFEVKESVNKKTGWKGTQALITPRGRETFRILIKGKIA